MGTLTVWKFADPAGAGSVLKTLTELEKHGHVDVYDGAVVSWEPGAKKPRTTQLRSTAGAGALGGVFWGFLFGLIFFVPLLGAAIGAGLGALTGSLADVGIDDDFIKRTRNDIQPGTSALFLLSTNAVVDKIRDQFGPTPMTLVESNF